MKKTIIMAGILLSGSMPAFSQTPAGFKHLPSGLDYKFVEDVPGKKTAKEGDYVIMHLQRKGNGNIVFDSRTLNNNEPVPYPVGKAQFAGDPLEVIKMLTKGDSVIIRIPMDSMIKAGTNILDTSYKIQEMHVRVVDVLTKKEMEDEAAKKAEEQKRVDDSLIRNYLTEHKIKATKTPSGLYYKIDEPGEGEVISSGKVTHVMYRGYLLDGSEFDKNFGPDAKHTDPIIVPAGQGRVIKGWDEGLQLLKKGSKATFYIPSGLGYGGHSPSPAIPANSVLIFDVEIKDVH